MVYVLSQTGKPLMPTERYGKVRWLLKSGKAKVVRRTPFTIQLLYETTEHTQPVTLGVDPGYQNVGLSAVTDGREVFRAEANVRTDIPRLMAHITIMRWKLYERVKALGLPVSMTYGYITKRRRKLSNLGKSHTNDAFVIAGGTDQARCKVDHQFRQVRRQNRKLFKGVRSHIRNTAPRVLHGFRVWDNVRYKGKEYFVKGRRSSGYFSLSDIDGQSVFLDGKKLASVKYSELELLEKATTLLLGRAVSSPE